MRLIDMLIKDIKTVVYDFKSLVIILIMPIVLMSILGASLQGVFGEENESGVAFAKIGVVKAYNMEEELYKLEGKVDLRTLDQETRDALNSEKSFFQLLDNDALQNFMTYTIVTRDEGQQMLEDEEIAALVILPKDFIFNTYMVLSGSRIVTNIEYIVNEDNTFVAGIVKSIMDAYVAMNNNIYGIQRTAIAQLSHQSPENFKFNMDTMMDQMASDIEAVNIDIQSVYREESITSFQYYAAAIMCMFLLYSAGLGGRALLMERKEKTIPRLSVSGNGLTKIVFSNYIRVMLLVLCQSIIMIAYSSLVLGVDWGDPVTILLTMVLTALAVAAIGMFIAIITLISDNYKVANAFEFGVIYIMALLGGSFVPVESLPAAIGKLGVLSLNGHALTMFINGMYDLPLSESYRPMGMLLAFTVVFIGLSLVLIKGKGRELAC